MIRSLLYLAILTAITVAAWVGFSVYHSYSTSTIDDATSIIITPIPGEFDKEVIESIKNKRKVEVDLNEQKIVISPTPIETIEEAEGSTATPSGQIEL